MNKKFVSLASVLSMSVALASCAKNDSASVSDTKQQPTVKISSGLVQGVSQNGITSYKGIPYAAAPVGNLRWAATRPAATWDGVLSADSFGADCMQLPFPSDAAPLGTAPAEDCLFVNIWHAEEVSSEPKPVVVWIHGGGFVNGGSSPDVYSGEKFAEKGVIFASFNYRLGRFGFFGHPALTAEDGGLGNYGYMDQVAAMKWIKENIAAFGGDPNKVTIMGESAGGGSVINLLTSADAVDTFSGAIVMSGGGRGRLMGARSVTTDVGPLKSAEWYGLNLAAQYGIEGTDANALAALRALSADQVTDGLNMASMRAKETYAGGPLSDGATAHPQQSNAVANGEFAKVPLLIGTTSMDIGFGFAETKDELFGTFGDNADAARDAYDPDGKLDIRILNMLVAGDRMMHEPAHYFAGQYAKYDQSAWVYRFSYVAESMRNEWPGAPHATDIPFFFNTIAYKYGDKLTALDQQAGELSLDYFVNFVKHGNPNSPELTNWVNYDPASPMILDISMDATAVVGEDPLQKRLTLVAEAR